MKKNIEICDDCGKRVSEKKCEICGKDLCPHCLSSNRLRFGKEDIRITSCYSCYEVQFPKETMKGLKSIVLEKLKMGKLLVDLENEKVHEFSPVNFQKKEDGTFERVKMRK